MNAQRRYWRSAIVWCLGVIGQPVGAAIYTVGTAGTHVSPQLALNAAATSQANDEIRLQALVFSDVMDVQVNAATGSLSISGGWNAKFTEQIAGSADPFATVINASNVTTTLRVQATHGLLEVSALRLVSGQGSDPNTGGNLTANVGGSAEVRFADVRFSQGGSSNIGAGALVTVFDGGLLSMVACSFANNRITAASGSTFGAGLAVSAFHSGRVELDSVSIFGNESLGGVAGDGSGLRILARDNSFTRVADTLVSFNSTTASGHSAAISVLAAESSLVDVQRIRVSSNNGTASGSSQLLIDNRDLATTILSDSLISDSVLVAFNVATLAGGGSVRLSNLTVIRNGTPGQLFPGSGSPITLHNSILHANGAATLTVDGSNNLGANLGLAAPVFASPGDYRLVAGSPGIDAGSAAIPGGLGALDIDRNPREFGASVDIGAAEFIPDALLQDGFE